MIILFKNKKEIDEAVLGHMWLVTKTANKYKSFGIDINDLVSEGTIGLIKAVHNFDDAKNCSVATYATFWIKSYIMQYIINNWSLVRFATTKDKRNAFLKDASQFIKDSSLNRENDKGQQYIDLVPDNDNIENYVIDNELCDMACDTINNVIRDLSPRERDIFTSRKFMEKPATLEELATKYKISKERVRQIENRVLEKIQKKSHEYLVA